MYSICLKCKQPWKQSGLKKEPVGFSTLTLFATAHPFNELVTVSNTNRWVSNTSRNKCIKHLGLHKFTIAQSQTVSSPLWKDLLLSSYGLQWPKPLHTIVHTRWLKRTLEFSLHQSPQLSDIPQALQIEGWNSEIFSTKPITRLTDMNKTFWGGLIFRVQKDSFSGLNPETTLNTSTINLGPGIEGQCYRLCEEITAGNWLFSKHTSVKSVLHRRT